MKESCITRERMLELSSLGLDISDAENKECYTQEELERKVFYLVEHSNIRGFNVNPSAGADVQIEMLVDEEIYPNKTFKLNVTMLSNFFTYLQSFYYSILCLILTNVDDLILDDSAKGLLSKKD